MPLTSEEEREVGKNIFPGAAHVLAGPAFPWHRDSKGDVTAGRLQSSQALAIDVFGTLKALKKPSLIIDALMEKMGIPETGQWKIEIERTISPTVLGEPRPTQVDASAESETALVFFECKFTETDGGACSQTKRIGGRSRNRGMRQCSGDYVMQVNPVNGVRSRCALTGKGILYWEYVPRVLEIDSATDHRPCPFRGGWYQWMRNLVACDAIAQASGNRGIFVVLYADGPFAMAEKVASPEWRDFCSLTEGKAVKFITLSYQDFLACTTAAAAPPDVQVLTRLRDWVNGKIDTVGNSTNP
ncbi:MAG: hypothetical protein BWX92_01587 [Deltaproteobacteria bacterium ADurb.Bin135]|nr:MAG: hypothetical protein BWX92_01587 [Deltaproteobacteria bacterium ADurb.Bin135]